MWGEHGNEPTTIYCHSQCVSCCVKYSLPSGLLQTVVLSKVRVDHVQLVRQGLVETGLWELILHPGDHEENGERQSGRHSQWKPGV